MQWAVRLNLPWLPGGNILFHPITQDPMLAEHSSAAPEARMVGTSVKTKQKLRGRLYVQLLLE